MKTIGIRLQVDGDNILKRSSICNLFRDEIPQQRLLECESNVWNLIRRVSVPIRKCSRKDNANRFEWIPSSITEDRGILQLVMKSIKCFLERDVDSIDIVVDDARGCVSNIVAFGTVVHQTVEREG